MGTVTLKGNLIRIKGDIPASGKASDFTFIKDDMSDARLSDYAKQIKVLIAVPSLDTSVCAKDYQPMLSLS